MEYATLLQNIIHACGTHRWHQHQQLGGTHETVAHHSTMVALIAHYLLRTVPNDVINKYAVMLACLTHDLGEYWVGDVPSPTKRAMGAEFFSALDSMERQASEVRLQIAPPLLTAAEQTTVHLADCLAGSLHCVNQILLGNRYARRPLSEYALYITDYCGKDEEASSVVRTEANIMTSVMWRMATGGADDCRS